MQDAYAVLAITLPDHFFPDDDDIARTAGMHLAELLGEHLKAAGYRIPEWVEGGCSEDAWDYFEAYRGERRFSFTIAFFPREEDDCSMAIQYGIKGAFWRNLFRGTPTLDSNDPIHNVMKEFGEQFENGELLTQRDFDSRY